MQVKASLEENKDHILASLPTQELKDQFLAELETIEETTLRPTTEEQVKEAQMPEHISEDMYDAIAKEINSTQEVLAMTEEEEKMAIKEALKNPPSSEDTFMA